MPNSSFLLKHRTFSLHIPLIDLDHLVSKRRRDLLERLAAGLAARMSANVRIRNFTMAYALVRLGLTGSKTMR